MRTSAAAPPRVPPPALTAPSTQRVSAGALVLGLALPILFLHVRYQPEASLPLGGTFKLQDAAVLAVAVAALLALRSTGAAPLRAGRWIWIVAALFLVWIVVSTVLPLTRSTPYAWRTHLVTAGEFVEYALLAPAVPLLVRRRNDALLVLGILVAWAAVATGAGVLQFAGVDILHPWTPGHRQPSFVGSHEFGALSGLALGVAAVGLLFGGMDHRRRVLWAVLVIGAAGFLLDASSSGVIGLLLAALGYGLVAVRRRLVSTRRLTLAVGVVLALSVAVVALRAKDFNQFLRFTGVRAAQASTTHDVQTYSQRTVLAYIGVKIWLSHPVFGAGWQASLEPATVGPVLPEAQRRFPDVDPVAFPLPQHEYGVQLLYVQTLSDLGVVGLVLLVALLGVPLLLGARTALEASAEPASAATLGQLALLLTLGLFTGIGLVAGLPTDAVFWLALGTIAAAAQAARQRQRENVGWR